MIKNKHVIRSFMEKYVENSNKINLEIWKNKTLNMFNPYEKL